MKTGQDLVVGLTSFLIEVYVLVVLPEEDDFTGVTERSCKTMSSLRNPSIHSGRC